jgi:hypothetical protein
MYNAYNRLKLYMEVILIEPHMYKMGDKHGSKWVSSRSFRKDVLKISDVAALASYGDEIHTPINVHIVINEAQTWEPYQKCDTLLISLLAIEQYYRIYLISGKDTFIFPRQRAFLKFQQDFASVYCGDITIFYNRKITAFSHQSVTGYLIGYQKDMASAKSVLQENITKFCREKNYTIVADLKFIQDKDLELLKEELQTQYNVKIIRIKAQTVTLVGPNKKGAVEHINRVALNMMKIHYDQQIASKEQSSASLHKNIDNLNQKLEEAKKNGLIQFPPYWENMALKPLLKVQRLKLDPARHAAEYNRIVNHMNQTVQCNINQIERIQNIWTWNHYNIEIQNFKLNGQNPNEMYFFHGTRGNPPDKIISSEVGLDIIFCDGGAYGKGVYLASKAQYSDSGYAYNANGFKQLFYVRALMGEIYPGGVLNELPINPATNRKYDSQSDGAPSPTIYVVKRSTQAYPEYLITYS